MDSEDKKSIVDQIVFYFQVKKVVDSYLKKYYENSARYSPQYSQVLSMEIKESYKMINNTLSGIGLTQDNKLWIENQINFRR